MDRIVVEVEDGADAEDMASYLHNIARKVSEGFVSGAVGGATWRWETEDE